MHYEITTSLKPIDAECLVCAIFADDNIPENLAKFATHLKYEDDVVLQTDHEGHPLLLIHCGDKNQYTTEKAGKIVKNIIKLLNKNHITTALLNLPKVADCTIEQFVTHLIASAAAANYQFLEFKTIQRNEHSLESLRFYLANAKHTEAAIKNGIAIGSGMELARNLANLPGNICTPSFLAEEAVELAAQFENIKTKIIHREEMRKLGMGALLAVAQGSNEPPQLIEMQYHGAASDVKPIVLVGKGITFDSGGISIKPAELMNEMKYDMAGAAAVFGTIKAIALLKLPVNVTGLVASAENMPGGKAIKPGDIVHSMSGLTVEITNTDAEGRLVLCDALTYARRYDPAIIIDIATLTGAMIIALGYYSTGFMTEDNELADMITQASRESCDPAWRMPVNREYHSALNSPIADLMNCSASRAAGSITAASFLSRFTESMRWAHMDIAGTGWITGAQREATGRPVALLVQLIRNFMHANN